MDGWMDGWMDLLYMQSGCCHRSHITRNSMTMANFFSLTYNAQNRHYSALEYFDKRKMISKMNEAVLFG